MSEPNPFFQQQKNKSLAHISDVKITFYVALFLLNPKVPADLVHIATPQNSF